MKKIILLFLILLTSGCYDYTELNELGLVSMMILDYKDGEYNVDLEFVNMEKESKNASYFISGTGTNFENSLNDAYMEAKYKSYLSHMSTFLITENALNESLDDIIDFLVRNTSVRKDFYFFIIDDRNSILEYENEKNISIGEQIKSQYELEKNYNAKYKTVSLRDILSANLKNKTYMMGTIKVDDEIFLDKTHLLYKNKDMLTLDETAPLLENILTKSNTNFEFGSAVTYQIYEWKVKTIPNKNGIKLELKANIKLLNTYDMKSENKKDLVKIEKYIKNELENYINGAIYYSKSIGYDIYNFDYIYYQKFPKDAYHGIYQKLNYDVIVDCSVNEKGLAFGNIGGNSER